MEYSGAGGKLIHEKNQKQKISWHCPFKCTDVIYVFLLFSIFLQLNCLSEVLMFLLFDRYALKSKQVVLVYVCQ